ncbi:hypothetical protein AYO20_10364 [Fonsecaea nubica]|uniref:Uncharacterized protein n=1 Tax=Fonsecaea nubica TaxID=856822 RepID=A0A178C777_9EURO|nr:hypothetical protein AYO20_10364 [Fonsecaea nubica]OAL25809.1 hypothetical protein AYO20_10364 [Fonsecaea nubica]
MGRGRPPSQRTEDEKLAIRREKVRLNVQAHRERQKLKKKLEALNAPCQPPKLRWVQETKWQSKRTTDSGDQKQVSKPEAPRCDKHPALEGSLSIPPSPEKQYTLGLLALFRSRLLPERVTLRCSGPSEQRLTTPCAPWVVRGYELATINDNPLLTGMLRALGLALLAGEHQREDIQHVAQRIYQTTLPGVSRQLGLLMDDYRHRSNDYPALMLSCHAAAMFELSASGSLHAISRHVRGLGCLLVHHFLVSKSMPEEMFDLLEEYRLFEIVFCLINRQQSVLTGTTLGREATYHNSSDFGNCHISSFSRLVDLTGNIPPIMVYVDNLKSRTGLGERELDRLHGFLKTLFDTTNEFQTWSEDFLANDARSVAETAAYISGDGDLTFPNLEVVVAWAYYLSFKIHTLDTYISVIEHVTLIQQSLTNIEFAVDSPDTHDAQSCNMSEKIGLLRSELVDSTKLLLRSLPYFSESSLGYIGRSLVAFPLETAKRALTQEFERRSGLTLPASDIVLLNLSDNWAEDIIDGLAVCKQIATNAIASGCALFSG